MTPTFQRKYLEWCRIQRESAPVVPASGAKAPAADRWDRLIRKMERELG